VAAAKVIRNAYQALSASRGAANDYQGTIQLSNI
jgi:hypothetical protein